MSGDDFCKDLPARYPDAAAFKGPHETGRQAAEAISPKCGRLQAMTLAAIRAAGPDGLTSDEAAAALGMDRWSIQPRASELRAKRLIIDSGKRRLNASGRNAVAWVAFELRRASA